METTKNALKKQINSTPTQWVENTLRTAPYLDAPLLTQAAHLTEKHGSVNAIQQGLQMANHLLALHSDTDTLAAALLLPMISSERHLLEHKQPLVPPAVEQLIRGVWLMESIEKKHAVSTEENQTQLNQLRQMLMAMVNDMRVVLLKLTEELVLLENAREASADIQKQLATRVRRMYAPLANRLGVGSLKWQLEDWAFRYLEPEEYTNISKALNMRRKDREQFIADMVSELESLVAKTHIKNVSVAGRAKHMYSIYRKLQRKQLDFSEIYDASALRVMVPSVADCYAVLGMVHAAWPHIASEFDDYIAQPKPNGYRSVHTAVKAPNGRSVEIQIRTHDMHDMAEKGVAAHWAYKEGTTVNTVNVQEKARWLKEVMDWQEEVGGADTKKEIVDDTIYVFTPQGDIVDLPKGATPLDFAYHIHTQLGHSCRGAKVNGHLITLTQPLKTGDQIHIQTLKNGEPSRDWLLPEKGYLVTHRARAKVVAWFKKQAFSRNVALGSALWEKATRHKLIAKEQLSGALETLHLETPSDLFAAIGSGEIAVVSVLNVIFPPEVAAPVLEAASTISNATASTGSSQVQTANIHDLVSCLAQCCKPIPGDDIMGYISSGRGVVVHQKNCRNIQALQQTKADRLLPIHWGSHVGERYRVALEIETGLHVDVVPEITRILGEQKLSLLSLETVSTNTKSDSKCLRLILQIQDAGQLHQATRALKGVVGVMSVRRL